jgi:3',5'-cyclic AMP phosphodiesterase CpdA
MPGFYYRPMSRQRFLATAAKTTALLGLASLNRTAWGQVDDKERRQVRLALLSDTHIPADTTNSYRGFRPVENLRQVLPQVIAAEPDAVMLNGDAARLTGELADYSLLRQMLTPLAERAPIHIGLGNHDHRENFFQIFPRGSSAGPVSQKHVTIWEASGLRFLVLDSLLYVDQVAGLLGQAQRAWLAEFLTQADQKPTVLFVHHTLGDGDGDLLDADRFFDIILPHRQVKAVLYGHSHVYSYTQREHMHLINLPAVGYNFGDDQPVGWVSGTFDAAGAALTLHAIGGNRSQDGMTTNIRWLN